MVSKFLSIDADRCVRQAILDRLQRASWTGGWLTPFFKRSFESEWIGSVVLSRIASALLDCEVARPPKQLVVIPNASWKAFGSSLPAMAAQVRAGELTSFLKEMYEAGTTDYYILNSDLKVEWIVAICHEGELHIAGSPSFVRCVARRYVSKA